MGKLVRYPNPGSPDGLWNDYPAWRGRCAATARTDVKEASAPLGTDCTAKWSNALTKTNQHAESASLLQRRLLHVHLHSVRVGLSCLAPPRTRRRWTNGPRVEGVSVFVCHAHATSRLALWLESV